MASRSTIPTVKGFTMKRLPLIITSLLTLLLLASTIFFYTKAEQKKTHFQVLSTAAELDAILSQKENSPLLVDLRDRKDFEISHIANFLNFSYDDDGKRLETWITPYKRDKQVILICYAGNRTARAFERLVLMGFRNIIDFSPGYAAYAAEKGSAYAPETGSCNCPE